MERWVAGHLLLVMAVAIATGCMVQPEPWRPDGVGNTGGDARADLEDAVLTGKETSDGDSVGLDLADVEQVAPGDAADAGDGAGVDGELLNFLDGSVDGNKVPDTSDGFDALDVPDVLDASEVALPGCPNGVCDPGESKSTCPADCCNCGDSICEQACEEVCPAECCYCGDGKCGQCPDMPAETVVSCAEDCSTCGDGVCSGKESVFPGESQCLVDCCGSCGDDICKGGECHEDDAGHDKYCPKDCNISCGNGECEGGESPANCPQDCEKFACGNNVCEPGESPDTCPQDCTGSCGDCECSMGESNETCPQDCGYCGDDICSTCADKNETSQFCPQDCCNDGNSCTDDISVLEDGVFTCSHAVNDNANCEGDLPCTTGDYCENGQCQPGEQKVVCDDGNPCTVGECNVATGGCEFQSADGNECDAGDPCTTDDYCQQGECQGGGVTNCDDGNQCTLDVCLSEGPVTGCVNQDKEDGTSCKMEPCGDSAVCEDGECVCE